MKSRLLLKSYSTVYRNILNWQTTKTFTVKGAGRILLSFLIQIRKNCLVSFNYTQCAAAAEAVSVHCAGRGRICASNMLSNENKEACSRVWVCVCTVQMWLWTCVGHMLGPNWLKSIGNRKRCRVLHSQSFCCSRDVSVAAPHVMASHEHTYIYIYISMCIYIYIYEAPQQRAAEQIRAKAFSTFYFSFLPRLRLSGGSCSHRRGNVVFRRETRDVRRFRPKCQRPVLTDCRFRFRSKSHAEGKTGGLLSEEAGIPASLKTYTLFQFDSCFFVSETDKCGTWRREFLLDFFSSSDYFQEKKTNKNIFLLLQNSTLNRSN